MDMYLIPQEHVVLADAVWHALKSYNAFYSATSSAFEAKASRFPAVAKPETAVIIIDVLRATTTLTAVGAAGTSGIHVAIKQPNNGTNPFTVPTESFGPWVGGGEENGAAIAGGCIANSPCEVTDAMFRNRYLQFFSTNGARAITSAEKSGFNRLYLACVPNVEVTVARAIADGARRVLFVGGGFYQCNTLEDNVCAGLGVKALIKFGFADTQTLDDEAHMALHVAEDFSDLGHFVRTLKTAQVGRLLTAIGRGGDIEAVITGAGVEPAIWGRMATTVLRYVNRAGIGLFVPLNLKEIF